LYQEVSNTLTGVSSGLSFTTSLFPYSALSRERMGSGISPSMRTLVRGVFTTANIGHLDAYGSFFAPPARHPGIAEMAMVFIRPQLAVVLPHRLKRPFRFEVLNQGHEGVLDRLRQSVQLFQDLFREEDFERISDNVPYFREQGKAAFGLVGIFWAKVFG